MSDWYYSHDGQQKGPVPISELERLVSNGNFDPEKDLVWREGMSDWKPVGSVPELQLRTDQPPESVSHTFESPEPAADPENPYAAPAVQSADHYPTDGSELPEIQPGTEPINIGATIAGAFELTKRHFGMILAIGVIMFAISAGVGLIMGFIDTLIGYTPPDVAELGFSTENPEIDAALAGALDQGSVLNRIVSAIVDVFLGLGIIRVGLNIIDGKSYTIGTLFSQGSVTLRAFLAQILFGLMVGVGLVLLIVPGIYLALRFGQYQHAIVDKGMGIFEAFSYSSRITQDTKMPLLGLIIVLALINVAGFIALIVGLVFTIPLTTLAGILAYRWMQHGSAVVMPR